MKYKVTFTRTLVYDDIIATDEEDAYEQAMDILAYKQAQELFEGYADIEEVE